MCHFFRPVSDHDKCGTILKLLTVGVHSCVVLVVLVVAMATGAKNSSKTEEKCTFSVICVILMCDLPPVNTPKGFIMVTKNFLDLFSVHSCQFYMIKIFWV